MQDPGILKQRYLMVQAEEGGHWRPAIPRKTDAGSQLGRGEAAGLKLKSRIARAKIDHTQFSIHVPHFIFGSR
jgi:hypothetical protein